jgi:hypothetical protein
VLRQPDAVAEVHAGGRPVLEVAARRSGVRRRPACAVVGMLATNLSRARGVEAIGTARMLERTADGPAPLAARRIRSGRGSARRGTGPPSRRAPDGRGAGRDRRAGPRRRAIAPGPPSTTCPTPARPPRTEPVLEV